MAAFGNYTGHSALYTEAMPRTDYIFPCGVCKRDTKNTNCIQCEICEHWFHQQCDGLNSDLWSQWCKIVGEYVCKSCAGSATFDYEGGLSRLKNAAARSYKDLLQVATREALLLENNITLKNPQLEVPHHCLPTDETASKLLKRHKILGRPLITLGDGNCLFHAISLVLTGTLCLSSELRYKTALMMLLRKQQVLCAHSQIQNIALISPDYEEASMSCATRGQYSCAWTVMALSEIIGHQIQILYPPENGEQDQVFHILKERFGISSKDTIYIMWTHAVPKESGKIWVPNHFVAVIHEDLLVHSTEEAEEENDWLEEEEGEICEESDQLEGQICEESDQLEGNESEDNSGQLEGQETEKESDEWEGQATAEESDQLDEPKTEDKCDQLVGHETEEENVELNEDEIGEKSERLKEKLNHKSWNTLQTGRFLSIDALMNVLQNTPICEALDQVPMGKKEDVFFIINNASNIHRRNKGRISQFWDDRGSWCKGASSKTLFLRSNKGMKTIVMKNNVLGFMRRNGYQKVHVPFDIPPPAENIVTLHRYYVKHASKKDYEKRVSWLEEQGTPAVACYEYKGTCPPLKAHGRTTTGNPGAYVRLHPKIMGNIKEQLKYRRPTDVYRMNDSFEGPRNMQQVKNAKSVSQRTKGKSGIVHKATFADQVAGVEELQHSNPFIKLIIRQFRKVPCIILYTDEQLADVKRFCCPAPSAESTILCVDKTYNLGDVHVTVTVLKYLALKRRITGDHPLHFGPFYLHGNSDTETFSLFFQHLASKLAQQPTNPIFGSDEEIAMTNAIRTAFPNSNRLSCIRHIKNNLKAYLIKHARQTHSERRRFIAKLFGEQGLLETINNHVEMRDALTSLEEKCPEVIKKYLHNNVTPLLVENIRTIENHKLPNYFRQWNNNNAESSNHILKQAFNWKSYKLVELVKKLHEIVKSQYREINRSFAGLGDLELTEEYQHFSVHRDSWYAYSIQRKLAHFHKFLATCKEHFISRSTVGNKSSFVPKSGGKKLGQRRCRKAEKTKSALKKKTIFTVDADSSDFEDVTKLSFVPKSGGKRKCKRVYNMKSTPTIISDEDSSEVEHGTKFCSALKKCKRVQMMRQTPKKHTIIISDEDSSEVKHGTKPCSAPKKCKRVQMMRQTPKKQTIIISDEESSDLEDGL